MARRIYLSPPHLGGRELEFLRAALDSNWIAPLGPQVDAFKREFADAVGVAHAAALSSGTDADIDRVADHIVACHRSGPTPA